MAAVALGEAFVTILDWKGKIVWVSNDLLAPHVGLPAWENMRDDDAQLLRRAVARTVSLDEKHCLEIVNREGARFRTWLWPLGTPDWAVCAFSLKIPKKIAELSPRERELMVLLAKGLTAKELTVAMDVSLNTVHSFAKRIREKLELQSNAEVLAVAARFFHPLSSTPEPIDTHEPTPSVTILPEQEPPKLRKRAVKAVRKSKSATARSQAKKGRRGSRSKK